MWARAWKPVPIRWRGFARIRAESARSISRIGHRKRRKATAFCSGKARQSGKTFLKRLKALAESSTTSSSRKAAAFLNSTPRAAACNPIGSSIQLDASKTASTVGSEGEFPAELKNARREGSGDLSKTGGAGVIHGGIVPVCPVEGV